MPNQFIHKPVVFNKDNPYHMKVYSWLMEETNNVSGYIFNLLAMRYEGMSFQTRPQPKKKISTEGWL